MMTTEIIPFGIDTRLEALFAASGTPEGSLAWFSCLAATTLDAEEEAVMAIARDGEGAARAALPLVRRGRTLRALTAPYTTEFVPALADVEAARALGREARAFVPSAMRLDALDVDAPGVAAFIAGLGDCGLAVARYRHFGNWYEPTADFEDYWRQRPSRLRSTVRRKSAQAPHPAFRMARSAAELDEALAAYEDVYRSSWKVPEPHAAFIPEMVRALGRNGLVRMGLLTFEGEVVAAQIWLVCRHRATIFKLAHRESAAAHSPGTLLTHWMASKLVGEDGIREIDFGRGDDPYKRDWLAESRARHGLIVADWRTMAGLAVCLRDVWPTALTAALRRHL